VAGGRWTKGRIVGVAMVAVVVLAGGAYAVFSFLAGGGPAPVSITQASLPALPDGETSTDLDGTWTVVADDSYVGYRVREQLATLPAPSDAVGRTTAVEGEMEVSGLSIESVSVTADMTQLTSDESRRDQRVRDSGPETNAFPEAAFVLTSPIDLDTKPAEGEIVQASAEGDLTVHGVTQHVSIPIEARWGGGQIQVAGSLEVVFADYDIQAPSFGGFVTVKDQGTIELLLIFEQA
jgi:polyisoprenoid-binding protein YceI